MVETKGTSKKARTVWQGMMNKKDDPVALQDIEEAKVKYEVTQAMLNLKGMLIVAVYYEGVWRSDGTFVS